MKMIDCYGLFRTKKKELTHLRAGVRRRLRINIHITMLRNHLDADERKFAESIT